VLEVAELSFDRDRRIGPADPAEPPRPKTATLVVFLDGSMASMNPYGERAEQVGGPRLMDSFLVYMDALGTEAAVSGPSDAVEARFQSFRSAWAAARSIAGLDDPSWLATSVFSDLVVAGLPILEDGEEELGSLLTTAISFQFFLSLEGIFVRGSFVRGLAWIDDSMVYGPALVRAYRIEQRDVVHPRVLIAEEVRQCIDQYAVYYGGRLENTPTDERLLVDGAGVVFIDYLQAAFYSPSEGQQVDSLKQHRDAVLGGLFDSRFNASAQDKMHWVVRYHNHFVSVHFPNLSELLVEPRSPELEFRRLSEGSFG
jgi:hypothetical protein